MRDAKKRLFWGFSFIQGGFSGFEAGFLSGSSRIFLTGIGNAQRESNQSK